MNWLRRLLGPDPRLEEVKAAYAVAVRAHEQTLEGVTHTYQLLVLNLQAEIAEKRTAMDRMVKYLVERDSPGATLRADPRPKVKKEPETERRELPPV